MKNWQKQVFDKYQRKNKILFDKQNLLIMQIQQSLNLYDRKCVTLWSLSLAYEAADFLNARYPKELQFFKTVQICEMWAKGKCKMPQAKAEILACHRLARDLSISDDCMAHALAQACSVPHTIKHAIGYPIYELSSLVYRYPWEEALTRIEARVEDYLRLLEKSEQLKNNDEWASFIIKKTSS